MNIDDLGWDEHFNIKFESAKKEGHLPARISQEHRNSYVVLTAGGEYSAKVSGKMRYETRFASDFPAVGDWVAITVPENEQSAIIHGVIPRKNKFSRKAVLSGGMPDTGGKTEEQVLVTNIETAFLVSGMDGDFNPRRIERYMTAVYDSGINPVIVLNKIDLCPDIESRIAAVESVAFDTPVVTMSALNYGGIDAIIPYLKTRKTAVFLGSSGVGKSTIINSLIGEEKQRVNPVRQGDDRGRHTTTSRELFVLPGGGIIIDTPGLREFQPWKDEKGTETAFEDIRLLADQCRFRDCRHDSEPECAVHRALAEGILDRKRFENYLQMMKEARYLELRKNQRAELAEKTRWKQISKWQKQIKRMD